MSKYIDQMKKFSENPKLRHSEPTFKKLIMFADDLETKLKASEAECEELKEVLLQYVYFCEDLNKFVIKQPIRSETLNQFKVLISSGKEFNARHKLIIEKLKEQAR